MIDPTTTEGPRESSDTQAGRRATSGAWLMLVALAAFAAFALLRQLG